MSSKKTTTSSSSTLLKIVVSNIHEFNWEQTMRALKATVSKHLLHWKKFKKRLACTNPNIMKLIWLALVYLKILHATFEVSEHLVMSMLHTSSFIKLWLFSKKYIIVMSMILSNAHSHTILVFPFFSKVPSP